MLRKLTEAYYAIRTHWVISFIIVAASLVLISVVLRLVTPVVPPIPATSTALTNVDDSKTTFQSVKYTGSVVEVPVQFTIAQLTPQQLSASVFTQTFTQKFGLKPVKNADGMWQSETAFMNTDQNTGEITFSQEITPAPAGSAFTNDMAVELAQKQLSLFFPNIPVQPLKNQVRFLADDTHAEDVDAEKAAFASVPFTFVVQTYPVLYKNTGQLPFTFVIDRGGQIKSLSIFPLLGQISLLGKKNSLSVDQVIPHILAGQAAITSFTQTNANKVSLSALTNVDLKTAEIQYRVDDTTQLVYPFYSFTGTAQATDGQLLNINLITPAVETGK